MINNIHIKNFRLFKNLEIKDLKKINLFVGRNNSGKSTILESIFLNIGATNAELPIRINAFRNLDRLDDITFRSFFHDFNIKEPIEIKIKRQNPKEFRNLYISPLFSQKKEKTIKLNEITKDEHTAINGSSIEGLHHKFEIKKSQKGDYESYNSDIRKFGPSFRLDQPINYDEKYRGIFLSPRSSPRDNALRLSKLQFEKKTEDIIKILRNIEPNLKSISLLDNNYIFADIGAKNLLPLNLLGDGINRILTIILAFYDNQDGVVMIDEIENGFHFKSLKVLWKTIFEATKLFNVQVFASTHSWENIISFSKISNELSFNNLKLFRVETLKGINQIIDYDYDLLQNTIESEWEIR